jgi:predicted aminopeptidase
VPAYSSIISASLVLLCLAGCAGPSWYAQAVSGHLELMRQREPIAGLVASPDTDPALAAQLRTAEAARRFAIEHLGLPDTGSYTRFVRTGRDAVTWNVVATPEFALEPRRWCFAVAGCVPYRGYFDREGARRFADAQRDRGYDVSVAPALAYSTLGWFDDPLLDTMLRLGDARLAATLFHEMAHEQLYLRGDARFNEAFASFVEARGLARWLESRGETEALERWRRNRRVAAEFRTLVDETRQALERLYLSDEPPAVMRHEKQAAFDRLRMAYRARVANAWDGIEPVPGSFLDDANNASLALIETYSGGLCAFAKLFDEAGADFDTFYALAAERAALNQDARRAWLEQSCAEIASTGDL